MSSVAASVLSYSLVSLQRRGRACQVYTDQEALDTRGGRVLFFGVKTKVVLVGTVCFLFYPM